MTDIIEVENKYYVSINSTYTDNRIRVLNHMDTFGIFDRWGNIRQIGEEVQGIYHNGMRFISEMELSFNGQRPLLLGSTIKEENEILSVDLTNPAYRNNDNGISIPKDTIYIGRSKLIRKGACYERIYVENYGNTWYEFELTLTFNADFRDIFEVRGIKREQHGEITEIHHVSTQEVHIRYKGLDGINRYAEIHLSKKPADWQGHSKAVYKIKLEPHEEQQFECSLFFLDGDDDIDRLTYGQAKEIIERELNQNRFIFGTIRTDNQQFNQWIRRCRHDLLSLLADTPYGKYPYAGVPWYNTPFGRDGLITAIETLWLTPAIARDVLSYLSATQATDVDAYRDAEPGKVIHEVREGEMAATGEIPFRQYYGSIDGTLLFVMLAGRYYERTGDVMFINSLWPNTKAAIQWIYDFGDSDSDGFIEYQHKNANGLTNQGWKDSFDSISHQDGRLAQPPIALCEVQAYAYEAFIQGAKLATVYGEQGFADKLLKDAEELKKKFNAQFWDKDSDCYVLALDGDKKPCGVVASNAGHCLFTGIADVDKGEKLANRLMQPDIFSGWGIRTLSQKEKRYNPMSYHNGSVWPHDVAIIANGLSKYDHIDKVLRLTNALFDATVFIEQQRLPELFCGFERRKNEGPTNYPVACSPQAWSVAAVYILLESCLHIHIDALHKKMTFNKPTMPAEVNCIRIRRLELGNGLADLNLSCVDGICHLEIIHCPHDWEISIVQ